MFQDVVADRFFAFPGYDPALRGVVRFEKLLPALGFVVFIADPLQNVGAGARQSGLKAGELGVCLPETLFLGYLQLALFAAGTARNVILVGANVICPGSV